MYVNDSTNLVIAGTLVSRDSEGRYSLNDLHRASGGKSKDKPAEWLRLKQTQELVSEFNSGNHRSLAIATSGGRNGGTYADKLLVISYAGWISPAFQLRVNQAFLDSIAPAQQAAFPVPTTFAEALRLAADQQEQIAALEHQAEQDAPKVEFSERVELTEDCMDMDAVAKMFGTGRVRLMKLLREQGILMAGNLPYQKYIDRRYFRVQITPYEDSYGRARTSHKTVVTGQGLRYLQTAIDRQSLLS